MENDAHLRGLAAQGYYALFCRQSLRFILEIGGPEALDRFEKIVRPLIANQSDVDTPDFNKTRDLAIEMIDRDLKQVRENPDLI